MMFFTCSALNAHGKPVMVRPRQKVHVGISILQLFTSNYCGRHNTSVG
jgi:hypothetical protein